MTRKLRIDPTLCALCRSVQTTLLDSTKDQSVYMCGKCHRKYIAHFNNNDKTSPEYITDIQGNVVWNSIPPRKPSR